MKVYKFHLLAPITNQDKVLDAFSKMHKYYNKLIEIENNKRDQIRLIQSSVASVSTLEEQLAAAELTCETAAQMIKDQRKSTRSNSDTAAQKKALKDANDSAKVIRASLRDARKALKSNSEIQDKIEACETASNERVKQERGLCGVYWGSYLLVENAVEAAIKTTPMYKNVAFKRWSKDAKIGVQFQSNATKTQYVRDVFGLTHSQLRITPQPGNNTLQERMFLDVRLGDGPTGKRNDILFARFPMLMHRDMPMGGIIKKITIHAQWEVYRYRWYCCITVDSPSIARNATQDMIGVDIGWRKLDGGIRVAYASNDESLVIPDSLIELYDNSVKLQSLRDQKFDDIKPKFVATVSPYLLNGDSNPSVTEAHKKQLASLDKWKSKDRLRNAIYYLNANKIDGLDLTEYLEWCKTDRHLMQYETGVRNQFYNRRDELYKNWANKLSNEYSTCVLEDFNISKIAEEKQYHNHIRQIVGVSNLVKYLKNEFNNWMEVDPYMTTHECNLCGKVDEFDAAAYIHHVCSGCGALWDQDSNAAVVICERGIAAKTAGTARYGKQIDNTEEFVGRWSKRKAAKVEAEGVLANQLVSA